jgi:holo-[acyl-carrier-protein] synthase
MIFGIGIDVLEAKRMTQMHRRFGTRIERHLLMPQEQLQFAKTRRKERFLAMRFAAKEAVVKAMGTGVSLTDEAGLIVAVAVLMRAPRRPARAKTKTKRRHK